MRRSKLVAPIVLVLAACASKSYQSATENPPQQASEVGESFEPCNVRLKVVCSDERLRLTAERALRRGLSQYDWIEVVHETGNIDLHVILVQEVSLSTVTDSIAISLCAVRVGVGSTGESAQDEAASSIAFHDVVICSRSDAIPVCESLADLVASRALEPVEIGQVNRALRIGETDLIDIDSIKGKYDYVDEKRR